MKFKEASLIGALTLEEDADGVHAPFSFDVAYNPVDNSDSEPLPVVHSHYAGVISYPDLLPLTLESTLTPALQTDIITQSIAARHNTISVHPPAVTSYEQIIHLPNHMSQPTDAQEAYYSVINDTTPPFHNTSSVCGASYSTNCQSSIAIEPSQASMYSCQSQEVKSTYTALLSEYAHLLMEPRAINYRSFWELNALQNLQAQPNDFSRNTEWSMGLGAYWPA